jgi:S1-C subfamily serine protease
MKKIVFISLSTILFSSCASIFLPRKQKISIVTGKKEAVVYIANIEFGDGDSIVDKFKKVDDPLQVIIKTPGYKDTYDVLFPTHRPAGYWPLFSLNVANGCLGMMLDVNAPHGGAYKNINRFIVKEKLVYRQPTDKYLDFSKISFDATMYDVYNVDPKHSFKDAELEANIKKAESTTKSLGEEKNEYSDVAKGKRLEEKEQIAYFEYNYSENMLKTLYKTGFIDTVNQVFSDNNNTLILEGSIKKIYFYSFSTRFTTSTYKKAKLCITWYLKNTYNEIVDSIETKDYSENFYHFDSEYDKKSEQTKFNIVNRPFADAVDVAYLRLHKHPKFTTLLKQNTNFEISDPVLTLNKPTSSISDKSDATLSSVIVKTKRGHGSGFAITNDGYIITNYHVVAGKYEGKFDEIKIITSDGSEVVGTIVRTNKFRDLALIKVDKTFEKVFVVSNEKTFKTMQDVYTIGAPKSIELGQSISSGVISNERKTNNNHVLQLGMSVNGGNSGGPLYDASGKLHGVIVAKLFGKNTEGVSFAIPGYMIEDYLKLKFN